MTVEILHDQSPRKNVVDPCGRLSFDIKIIYIFQVLELAKLTHWVLDYWPVARSTHNISLSSRDIAIVWSSLIFKKKNVEIETFIRYEWVKSIGVPERVSG